MKDLRGSASGQRGALAHNLARPSGRARTSISPSGGPRRLRGPGRGDCRLDAAEAGSDLAPQSSQLFHDQLLRRLPPLPGRPARRAVQTLSEEGQDADSARVAIDSLGRAVVVWQRSDGSKVRIQAARGDAVAPETQIDSGPVNAQTISDNAPSFAFSGSPPEWIGYFECSIDSGSFDRCTSPVTLGPLADGDHTFVVRTVDLDGDLDPTPASRSFTVDTPPPPSSPPPAEDTGGERSGGEGLPEPSTPPGSQLPGDQGGGAPLLDLTAKGTQKAGKPIILEVGCDKDCAVTASGNHAASVMQGLRGALHDPVRQFVPFRAGPAQGVGGALARSHRSAARGLR